MRQKDRWIPYRWPEAWWQEYRRRRDKHWPHWLIVQHIRLCNTAWRLKTGKDEKCEARTRQGTPCQAPAKMNGRCKLHGGLSTGARTDSGKAKALSKLRQNRES